MIEVPVYKPDGARFGSIEISCIEVRGRQPDDINVYEGVIRSIGGNYAWQRSESYIQRVEVEHRYGDHWTVLLRKVLAQAEVDSTTN